MKVLVTGGAGFIGSQVVKQLLDDDFEVRILHLPNENLINLQGLDVDLFSGDITDQASVKKALKGCSRVFHLAAIYALWLPRTELMLEVNVGGTENVLQACLDAGIEKVVYTSSIAVFGGQGVYCSATEESQFALGATGDIYSQTKYESHMVAKNYFQKGLNISIVAPCGPVGPGDIGPTPTGRLILSAINMPLMAVNHTSNNVIDVRDVAAGHLLAMEKGKPGRTYLLGNENHTLEEVAGLAMKIAGRKVPLLSIPDGVVMLGGYVCKAYSEHVSKKSPLITPEVVRIAKLGLNADCTRARIELGLQCRPLEESMQDALQWFAQNGYINSKRIEKRLLYAF